jgi:sulfate adenylyltransferase subunit 2
VLLRLAQKAFYPGPIPFPLLHVDTTYKFREMIQFRDDMARAVGARLIVHTNEEAISEGTQPLKVGTQRCCGLLKTKSLLDALQAGDFDAAIGGARRDEEKSRAKERVFSIRDANGQWDPKRQRPELWNLLNARIRPGESIRVFPLSNWTELDVGSTSTSRTSLSCSFREDRGIVRGNSLLLSSVRPLLPLRSRRSPAAAWSLGCSPCTGAVRSDADTVEKIIAELDSQSTRRQLRVIDHDQDGSMEMKKREGYF